VARKATQIKRKQFFALTNNSCKNMSNPYNI